MRKIVLSIIVFICIERMNVTAQYWSALGAGLAGGLNGGSVYSLAAYNGELYAAGNFSTAGGIPVNNIAKWNGTTWSAVGSGIDPGYYRYHNVSSLITYNGELYASGYFSIAGGVAANNIAKWNGTNWSPVGSGVSSSDNLSISLAVYNGELYASGLLVTAGGVPVNNIAKWNGTNWSSVGSGTNGWVHALVTHNGELYAGGRFSTAGAITVNNVAKWNGTNWSSVGSGIHGRVYSLISHNGELYAGGNFDSAGSASTNNIAKWNGTNWLALNSGMNGNVYTMSVHDGSLYAGGNFDSTGSVASKNIAMWDGSNWAPVGNVGSGMNNGVLCLTTHNGAIYAGGLFYTAGNVSATHIAKWTNLCTAAPTPSGIIIGDTNACQNGYLTYYSISPVNDASDYTWILPSGWSGNSINNIITSVVGDSSGIISVVANNPCGSSIPQTLAVNVYPVPSAPSVIYGNNSVCENSNQTYFVNPTAGATNYSWYLPYNWVGNSSTDSLSVIPGADGGTIYVAANNNYCSSDFQLLDVFVSPIPSQPEYINGNNIVCQSSSQSYFIGPVNYASDFTWTIPPGWSGSSISDRITVIAGTNGGTISVTANNQCGSSSPQTIVINVQDTVLSLSGPIIGNNSVCINSPQTYSVNPIAGATNYLWSLPSGWIGNSTTNTITTTAGASSGEISVIARNSCIQSNAQTFSVTINTAPQPGAIAGSNSVNNGQMVNYSINQITGATSYTWTVSGGGTIVSGQNTNSIIVDWQTPGNYMVSVKANYSCGTSIDQTLTVTVSVMTGVSNIDNSFELTIRPNPSSGEFYLKAKRVQDKLINVEVFNMTGQLVFRSGERQGTNDYTQLINLDKMAMGLYAVKIMIGDKVYVRSVMINQK